MLASRAEDFVDKMGNGGFTGGAGDTDELHVADRVTVVAREKLSLGALALGFERRFFSG